MHPLSQLIAVTGVGLKTIPQRKGASASAVFGIAGVVGVLVAVLSISQGLSHVMKSSGQPDRVIVLRAGADSEMTSGFQQEDAKIIADAPGIARGADGPIVSAELFAMINLPKRSTGTDANVPLRGVQPAAFELRQGFEVVAGRRFETGKNEIMVGVGAEREFAGLALDSTIRVGKNEWTVVGVFTAGGGVAESEIWCDAPILQAAYQRGNTFQSVYAKLQSPDAFTEFKDALTADPRLNVKVTRLTDYFEEQSAVVSGLVTAIGGVITLLMSLGAVFGALNTMYTSVSARTHEIATLRALGFGRVVVVIAVLIESLALALCGGIVGSLFAYVIFDGFNASTMNWASFSQVTFAFRVTPGLIFLGVAIAVLIGFVGGLFPAIRAARLPVASAIRETL